MKLFYGKHEELLFLLIIAFCLGLLFGILSGIKLELLSRVVITLSGTFFGAFLAYKLANRNEKNKEIKTNVKSCNLAIFKLTRTYNAFQGYKNQFINPFRESPARHIEILPSIGLGLWDIEIDFESLSYLINSNEPNIISELASLQDEMNSTREMIKIRDGLHFEKVQAKMSAAQFVDGADITKQQIIEIIGHSTYVTLQKLTDDAIEFVDSICEKTRPLIERLHEVNKVMYRTHSIATMRVV